MADSKTTQLTELTTPSGDDLLTIVDDPAGTPTSKKITVTNLLSLAAGGGLPSYLVTGARYPPTLVGFSGTASSASHANNTTFSLFYVPGDYTVDTMAVNCTTLEAGSTARLGVYTVTGLSSTGITGDLVNDAGTVSGAATGVQTLNVNISLSQGLYAFAVACSNHSTVRWRRPGPASELWGESTTATSFTAFWSKTGVDYSAALPSTIPSTLTVVSGSGSSANGYVEIVVVFA